MSKTFEVKNHIFSYEIVNDAFVIITGYQNSNGKITFSKEKENEYTYTIDVPETIENLPVFYIAPFYIDMKTIGIDGYRHNGTTVIVMNLPQNTIFTGFAKFHTSGGFLYPSYKVCYYNRTDCNMLFYDDGSTYFFAKKLDSKTCEIALIGKSHWHSNNNVWDEHKDIPHTYIEIPENINNYKVVRLAPNCTPKLPKSISVIKFSDDIETIGQGCFNSLPKLKDIYLGRNLRLIEDNCFCYYESDRKEYLTYVPQLNVHYYEIPQKSDSTFSRSAVANIGEDYSDWGWMQTGSENITYDVVFVPHDITNDFEIDGNRLIKCMTTSSFVSVPDGISVICSSAFENNIFLEKVILPDGVENIDDYAFANCQNLKEIVIPETVTHFGTGAFQNCAALSKIKLPENTIHLGNKIFNGCISLDKIDIPNGPKTIGSYTFCGCGIKEVVIPKTVTDIDSHAFENCSLLETIHFKGTINNIDYFAFDECPSIKNIIIPTPFPNFRKHLKTKEVLNVYIEDLSALCTAKSSCIDPPYMLYINNEPVSDLVIPSDVSKIEDAAFSGCQSIRSVTIPGEVTEIGEDAFYECINLENVNLCEGLKFIGNNAFQSCPKLKSVSFPESITNVGIYAFGWCDNFQSIKISSVEKWCQAKIGDDYDWGFKKQYRNPFTSSHTLYCGDKMLTELTIPGSVTNIERGVFYLCKSITKLIIQDGVKNINNYAFSECEELHSVILPESVEYIGYDAFGNKTNELSIYAPNGSYAEKWAKDNNINFIAQKI